MNTPFRKVSDIARSVSFTHNRAKPELIFLNTSDISLGRFLHRQYTDVSRWPGQAKKSISKNDILFSEIRPANGRWAFVNFESADYVVSTKLMVIRVDEMAVLPKYFYTWLTSPAVVDRLQGLAESRSGTFPQITFDDVGFLELPLPELPEQRAIVATLGALDEKIELNRKMNATLEAMARALFRDWFVDFGPTRAKMEGRASYLSPDLWALFPDRLDDETGLPEGWHYGTLSDVALLNPESWGAKGLPNRIEYVDLANTKWGTIEKTESHDRDAAPSRARRVLREGDTIVGTVRPGNGSFAYVGNDGLTGSTGFAVLRPRDQRERVFVWCAATAPENIDRLSHLADGGAYPAVRPDVVSATEIVLPGDKLLSAFATSCAEILILIEANKHESRILAETRDILLPKLMSGEIRLREAEIAVEAVA